MLKKLAPGARKLGPWLRRGLLRGVASAEAPEAFATEFPSRPSSSPREDLLQQWISPGATLYVNPICSQMDQMLLKCEEIESVLALLVTHRGVFFVHNLVTAIQVLGSLADDIKDPMQVNRLLRDPRYDVLLRDLFRFVPKLDFLAMTNVACSLQQLDHKYYPLLSRMLRPLLNQSVPDVTTLLRCINAYHWAGYHQQTNFYSHFAAFLADSAPQLSNEELVQSCGLFAGAAQYQDRFFRAAEERLLSQDMAEYSPHQLSLIASAFTVHLAPFHDLLLTRIAEVVEKQAMDMPPRDVVRCLSAFHRAVLYFPGAVQAGLAACSAPLYRAWLLRAPAELRSSEVAELLESAAFFGVETDLVQVALDYLTDRVDEITERASIQVVFAMCLTGTVATHSKLLLFLFRKIGAGTAWESHRMRVFHLWVSQLLQFPWLDARMKRRCIDQGLRAWCLHRRGFGCPHPEEVREVSAELRAMDVKHRTFVAVKETPYEVDVVVGPGKYALLVASETARNTLTPVGSTLLQMKHLKDRGWRCLVIPRRAWDGLAPGLPGKGPKAQYLRALLDGFLPPAASLLAAAEMPKKSSAPVDVGVSAAAAVPLRA